MLMFLRKCCLTAFAVLVVWRYVLYWAARSSGRVAD
jgi:hypothetical protein